MHFAEELCFGWPLRDCADEMTLHNR